MKQGIAGIGGDVLGKKHYDCGEAPRAAEPLLFSPFFFFKEVHFISVLVDARGAEKRSSLFTTWRIPCMRRDPVRVAKQRHGRLFLQGCEAGGP